MLAAAYGCDDRNATVSAISRRIGHLLRVAGERHAVGDPWALATRSHLPLWRRVRDYVEDQRAHWR